MAGVLCCPRVCSWPCLPGRFFSTSANPRLDPCGSQLWPRGSGRSSWHRAPSLRVCALEEPGAAISCSPAGCGRARQPGSTRGIPAPGPALLEVTRGTIRASLLAPGQNHSSPPQAAAWHRRDPALPCGEPENRFASSQSATPRYWSAQSWQFLVKRRYRLKNSKWVNSGEGTEADGKRGI